MKTSIVCGMGIVVMAFGIAGCAEDPPEEQEASTASNLSAGCVRGIQAPVGSAAWRAELQRCLSEDAPATSPGAPGGGGGGGGQASPGQPGQSCSSSIQCTNGSCTCGGGGPNQGRACVGSRSTGDDSCSVLCRSCS
jgi:hypothetical protein